MLFILNKQCASSAARHFSINDNPCTQDMIVVFKDFNAEMFHTECLKPILSDLLYRSEAHIHLLHPQ